MTINQIKKEYKSKKTLEDKLILVQNSHSLVLDEVSDGTYEISLNKLAFNFPLWYDSEDIVLEDNIDLKSNVNILLKLAKII